MCLKTPRVQKQTGGGQSCSAESRGGLQNGPNRIDELEKTKESLLVGVDTVQFDELFKGKQMLELLKPFHDAKKKEDDVPDPKPTFAQLGLSTITSWTKRSKTSDYNAWRFTRCTQNATESKVCFNSPEELFYSSIQTSVGEWPHPPVSALTVWQRTSLPRDASFGRATVCKRNV